MRMTLVACAATTGLTLAGCETTGDILTFVGESAFGEGQHGGGDGAVCSKCSGTGRQAKLGTTGSNRSSSGMVRGSRMGVASGDEACSLCGGSGSR